MTNDTKENQSPTPNTEDFNRIREILSFKVNVIVTYPNISFESVVVFAIKNLRSGILGTTAKSFQQPRRFEVVTEPEICYPDVVVAVQQDVLYLLMKPGVSETSER